MKKQLYCVFIRRQKWSNSDYPILSSEKIVSATSKKAAERKAMAGWVSEVKAFKLDAVKQIGLNTWVNVK